MKNKKDRKKVLDIVGEETLYFLENMKKYETLPLNYRNHFWECGENYDIRKYNNTFFVLMGQDCDSCGEKVKFEIRDNKVCATTECSYPNGYSPYCFEIDILSGKMILSNDLRDLFEEIDEKDGEGYISVNATRGCEKTSKLYAKQGLAHGIVGDTCPDLYRVDKDKYVISSTGYPSKEFDDIDEEDKYIEKYCTKKKGWKNLGGICTDLWWFSICDYELFQKNGGRLMHEDNLIDITPGRYLFKHQYHLVRDRIFDEPEIYTEIELIKGKEK